MTTAATATTTTDTRRTRSQSPLLDLVLLLLLLASLCATSDPSDETEARTTARAFLAALHSTSRSLRISIEPVALMPFEGAIAHTTADAGTGTCTLHFTETSARSLPTIAHEACHCALDFEYLGPHGYLYIVSPELATRFEHRAQRCATWLMSRRANEWIVPVFDNWSGSATP